ncbi:MAG: Sua5/YciO/YrdC/YwlC family protein [Pirellulaceae bacterium]
MAKSFDWKSSTDQRDIVHIVVQTLVEGRLAVLPTETAYHVVCSALQGEAVRQLNSLLLSNRVSSPSLLIRDPEETFDYSPGMSRIARRAAYRGWPGPLVLELPVELNAEQFEQFSGNVSLVHRLPEEAKSLLLSDGYLAQRVVPHPVVAEAMTLTPGPLIAAPCVSGDNESISNAVQAKQALDEHCTVIVDDGDTHFGGFAMRVRVSDSTCDVKECGVIEPDMRDRLFELIVLIVCTGNTCRSPMAEVLMKKRLAERFPDAFANQESQIHVSSAGLNAFPGGPASSEAQLVMDKCGLDLGKHQSRTVTEQGLRQADLVLTMTNGHRNAILNQFPDLESKVHLLSGGREDVSDPFGGTESVYAACAEQIDGFVEKWVERIDDSWVPTWKKSS